MDPRDEAAIARLVSRPHVVEVLDALTARARTGDRLRRELRARRTPLVEALRALAAHGAIRRHDHQGSWDGPGPAGETYELTDTGHRLVELLERVDVWDALYQRYRDSR